MKSLFLQDIDQLLSTTVVIAHNDPEVSPELANELRLHAARVVVAEDASELFALLLLHKARVAVLDLDLAKLEEVRQLARTYCDLTIICTHPSPDDRVWVDTLDAGPVDVCHPDDIRSMLMVRMAAA